jgi:hypothetical protein
MGKALTFIKKELIFIGFFPEDPQLAEDKFLPLFEMNQTPLQLK